MLGQVVVQGQGRINELNVEIDYKTMDGRSGIGKFRASTNGREMKGTWND